MNSVAPNPAGLLARTFPPGWTAATIADVATISSGRYIPRADYRPLDSPGFLVAGAGGPIGRTDRANAKGPVMTLGRVGAAGVLNIYTSDVWATDNALVVTPKDADLFGWLALFFRQVDWESLKTGSTQPLITQSRVLRLTIPLPPLDEQRRIAERIEAVLARASAAKERLARAQATMRRFRQSVLSAACSGRLTADWRGDGGEEGEDGLPAGWRRMKLGDALTLVTSGSRGWAKYYSDAGPLFIRSQDISSGQLDIERIAHVVPPSGAEGARTRVRRNDLLVTITGANVTASARVVCDLDEAYVSQHVALLRPSDQSWAPYLSLWLKSVDHGRGALTDLAYGAGRPGLNLDNLRDLVVDLPPIPEQCQIGCRVTALAVQADATEQHLRAAGDRTQQLVQATLAKAFRGELSTGLP